MYSVITDGYIIGTPDTLAEAIKLGKTEVLSKYGLDVEILDNKQFYLIKFERYTVYGYPDWPTGNTVTEEVFIEATIYPALKDALIAEQDRLTSEDIQAIAITISGVIDLLNDQYGDRQTLEDFCPLKYPS